MKKEKFIVRFDDDSEVLGFDKNYIFDNERDAKNFFESYAFFIEFNIHDYYFTFKGTSWNGGGQCFYAVYH